MNAPDRRAWLGAAGDAASPAESPATERPLRTGDAGLKGWGIALLLAGLGGFGWWAASAPIDEAVPAPGVVVVSDYRKTVQAASQGVITAIRVREGDAVVAGQALVVLDRNRADAEYEFSRTQWFTARAVEARLLAERALLDAIAFPADLLAARGDPRASAAMTQQLEVLRARRTALDGELFTMEQGLETLAAQIAGTASATQAREDQLRLLEEQVANERTLVAEGFLPRNRLLEQQRGEAQLRALIAEDRGTIARLRGQQSELRARIAQRRLEFSRDSERELAEVQRDAATLQRRLDALRVDVVHTRIDAPVGGKVVGLAVHTVGGVVQAGTPLMDIVPADEPLRVDARVPPEAIDRVRSGLAVEMLFTAFNQSTTPRIPGRVATVAADATVDPATRLSHYRVSVEVTPEGERMLSGLQVRAGMPAEVYVVTGERTFLSYLFRPVADRLRAAFTER